MSSKKWLLLDGKIFKLVDSFSSKQEALNLACALNENCQTTIHKQKDGNWAVYWRPYRGTICFHGIV